MKKDKELKEMVKALEELNKLLENVKGENEKSIEKFEEFIKAGFDNPAEISIKKQAGELAECKISGTTPAILVTLASLENSILKDLDVPAGMFEMIKLKIGTKKANKEANNE